MPEEQGRDFVEYGWIVPLLLFCFISLIPILLPMASIAPEAAKPPDRIAAARAHRRTVLLIVDGLGIRKALAPGWMPRLRERTRKAAFGTAWASYPTITAPGITAIMAGHRTHPRPRTPEAAGPEEIDSVLSRASAARLRSIVVGQYTWKPLFKGHGAVIREIAVKKHNRSSPPAGYDAQVLKEAEGVLRGRFGAWDLLVLHFFEPDLTGHVLGTVDKAYKSHMLWLDERIEAFSAEAQAQAPTEFLLLADHGQSDEGTHGDMRTVVRTVPFLLWGPDSRAGALGDLALYDAAPTLSALLGIPPPAASEGWPALAGLRLAPQQKLQIWVDLLRQRAAYWAAVRAEWPYIHGDPNAAFSRIRALRDAGNYSGAARLAESCAKELARAINDALPERWLGRLIAALWCLVLASCFALVWHRTFPAARAAAMPLSLACLASIVVPWLLPAAWAWGSVVTLATAAAILGVSLAPGFKLESGLDRFTWAMLGFGLAGIAFQEVVDARLWASIVVAGLLCARLMRLTRENALTSAISVGAALLAAALASGAALPEDSLVRSLLPGFPAPQAARVPWRAVEAGVLLFLLGSNYFFFVKREPGARGWATYALVAAPLASACVLAAAQPDLAFWSWAVCLLSLYGIVRFDVPPRGRGTWLSLVALAFYRSMATEREWCLLALAVVVGYNLAWKSADRNPSWEGLGLLGMGLWSYQMTGGQLDFSRISAAEGTRLLGGGWSPAALRALVALKHFAAFGAPILPWLSSRGFGSVLGVVPFLGALSAGNLSVLWCERFMQGGADRLSDHAGYARMAFVLSLCWMMTAVWAAASSVDWIAARLRRVLIPERSSVP